MILIFQCNEEIIKFDIDRSIKKLVVTSSKTNYQPIQIDWKMLFDKGKEKLQENLTDQLDDNTFKQVIVEGMKQFGYLLVKKEKENVIA